MYIHVYIYICYTYILTMLWPLKGVPLQCSSFTGPLYIQVATNLSLCLYVPMREYNRWEALSNLRHLQPEQRPFMILPNEELLVIEGARYLSQLVDRAELYIMSQGRMAILLVVVAVVWPLLWWEHSDQALMLIEKSTGFQEHWDLAWSVCIEVI